MLSPLIIAVIASSSGWADLAAVHGASTIVERFPPKLRPTPARVSSPGLLLLSIFLVYPRSRR
jgi:hypothetical protein